MGIQNKESKRRFNVTVAHLRRFFKYSFILSVTL